jgi:hypothetical protein
MDKNEYLEMKKKVEEYEKNLPVFVGVQGTLTQVVNKKKLCGGYYKERYGERRFVVADEVPLIEVCDI